MPQPRKFYGFVRFSDCYHESQGCPVIRHVMKRGTLQKEVREYSDEAKAVSSGHMRRCRLCLGDKVLAVDGNERDRVHISDEQHAVLCCVVDIHSKSGPMTLRQISDKRSRSVVSTYLIIKRLRKDGLVAHKLKVGGLRASGRSIIPTKRGLAVAASPVTSDLRTPR
jgi:hypothetical protein